MPTRSPFLLIAGLAVAPAFASGQTCAGLPTSEHGPFQVFGTTETNEDALSLAGGLGVAGRDGFVQVRVGSTSLPDLDRSTFDVGGNVGFEAVLDRRGTWHACPIVGLSVALIDDFTAGVDFSETDVFLGVSLGAVAARSSNGQVIPSASLGWVSVTGKLTNSSDGMQVSSATESFWVLGFGAGVVFGQRITVRPGVSIPLGLEGGKASAGATVSVSFGKRSRKRAPVPQ